RHAGDNRRLEEVALVADAVAAGRDLAALADRILQHTFDRRDAAIIGQRAHSGIRIEAVANLDRLRALDELLDELVVDAFLDQEAGRRNADLAGIAILRRDHDL